MHKSKSAKKYQEIKVLFYEVTFQHKIEVSSLQVEDVFLFITEAHTSKI